MSQVPLVVESVWPWMAVPEMAGSAVFTGASPVTVPEAGYWAEVAGVEP